MTPDPWGDQYATFRVLVDGSVAGDIRSGQTKDFKVPVGKHTVRIKYKLQRSNDMEISLGEGQTLVLACTRRKMRQSLLRIAVFFDLHRITPGEQQMQAERRIEAPVPRNLRDRNE
jgi:hypothetical protein